MSFGLLCDTFWDHPKVVAAGNEAVGVWVRAKGYCDKQLTDGFVPDGVLAMIAGPRLRVLKAALLRETLFDQAEGGVLVHDYLKHNPSKAEVLEKREAARQKKAAQRAKGAAAAQRGEGGRYTASPDVSPGDNGGDGPGDSLGDSRGVSSATHAHPTGENLSDESFSHARERSSFPQAVSGERESPLTAEALANGLVPHAIPAREHWRVPAWVRSHFRKNGCTNPERCVLRGFQAYYWARRGDRKFWRSDWAAELERWGDRHQELGGLCRRQRTDADDQREAAGRKREAQAGGRGVVVRHPAVAPAPLAAILSRAMGDGGDAPVLTPEQREELRREELRRQASEAQAAEVAS